MKQSTSVLPAVNQYLERSPVTEIFKGASKGKCMVKPRLSSNGITMVVHSKGTKSDSERHLKRLGRWKRGSG